MIYAKYQEDNRSIGKKLKEMEEKAMEDIAEHRDKATYQFIKREVEKKDIQIEAIRSFIKKEIYALILILLIIIGIWKIA